MDIQLKEIIDKIKTEGVEAAEEKAKIVVNNAEKKAADILEKAKQDADEMVSKAKNEITQFEGTSKEAIKQAGRDLILNIRKDLTDIFDAVIKREVKEGFSDSIIEETIPILIKNWIEKGVSKIDLLLSEKEYKELETALMKKLADQIKSGVEIKPYPNIQTGFRIAEREGDAYYDFTDEGIAEFISQHMNPRLSEMIMEIVSKD